MRINPLFFLSIICIIFFSLSTIWSNTPELFSIQLTFILVSLTIALLIYRQSPQFLKTVSPFAYFLILIALVLTFILGQVTRGSVRWIEIGPFKLQTSEISKPLLILSFAHFFTRPIIKPLPWLINKILLILPIVFLVFLQPDLGSTIIISIIWFGMLLGTSLPRRYILILLSLGIISLPLAFTTLQPYQKERLTTFLNPYSDPSGSGYNVIQSQIAIGSGKLFGKGIRQGTQSQLRFLPERHTDFAFASFAEEFGFLGAFILISSFLIILLTLSQLGENHDPFSKLIATGVFWLFFAQIAINIGMNLGIMPVTGITLPLFSYGGSSILSLGMALGLSLALTKRPN